MRSVAIYGQGKTLLRSLDSAINVIDMHGVPVACGLVESVDPVFDGGSPEHTHAALVKVRAFSCNFRDKNLILKMATRGPDDGYYVIGSEFVAEVVAVGSAVSRLAVGDRVIGWNHWPTPPAPEMRRGIPTNHASRELQVLHEKSLIKIPDAMSDTVAAAFSIGAQTAYSMVRKLDVEPGDPVLVTAARSNTSLFVINALRKCGARILAMTTSTAFDEELGSLGVDTLFHIDPELERFSLDGDLKEAAAGFNGFDRVIDPFFDLHLGRLLELMSFGCRYVTCGFCDQYSQFTDEPLPQHGPGLRDLLATVMVKNIVVIGNCLGEDDDLSRAIGDFEASDVGVVVDSAFGADDVGPFLERTYIDGGRFGKVIFAYD